MKGAYLVEAVENETKFRAGNLGLGNFRHLIQKACPKVQRNT